MKKSRKRLLRRLPNPTRKTLVVLSLLFFVSTGTAAYSYNIIDPPRVIYDFDISKLNGGGPYNSPAEAISMENKEENSSEQEIIQESLVEYDQTEILEIDTEEKEEVAVENQVEIEQIEDSIVSSNPDMTNEPEDDPLTMSSKEIILELYANEPDQVIKEMALESTQILTGEKRNLGYTNDGFVMVTEWDYKRNAFFPPNTRVVGSSDAYVAKTDGLDISYGLVERSTYNDGTKMQNKDQLRELYKTVKEVVSQTSGLSEREKVTAFVQWIQQRIEKFDTSNGESYPGAPAYVLATGKADCDGFANLFYLFAINSGMQCKVVTGKYIRANHAWNKVFVDGVWYNLDMTTVPNLKNDETIQLLGYQEGEYYYN